MIYNESQPNREQEQLSEEITDERVGDESINQLAQTLISNGRISDFENLLKIEGISERKNNIEKLYRLIIGCYIKTRFRLKTGWQELDVIIKHSQLPLLKKEYSQLKSEVELLIETQNEFEQILEMDFNKVSVGADLEPMINVIGHEKAESTWQ